MTNPMQPLIDILQEAAEAKPDAIDKIVEAELEEILSADKSEKAGYVIDLTTGEVTESGDPADFVTEIRGPEQDF